MSLSATEHLRFRKRDQQTPIHGCSMDLAVAAGGQAKTALEATLRQLEPMNDRRAQLWRQHAVPAIARSPSSMAASTASAFTPGRATSTSTSRSVSRISAGGSHDANRSADAAGRKNSRCRRSAHASISQASDHIQSRGELRFIVLTMSLSDLSGPPENFNGIYHFWAPSSKLRLNGLGWDSKRISRGVASENSIQCDSQSPTESEQDRRMIVIGLLLVRMLCDGFKPGSRLEAEILILRHQLNVLQQRTPRRRLHLRWVDRALFIWLYRRYPRILDAMSMQSIRKLPWRSLARPTARICPPKQRALVPRFDRVRHPGSGGASRRGSNDRLLYWRGRSDQGRLMHALDSILELLSGGEHCSGDIVAVIQREFGITQPAVSQHLKVLRNSGF